MLYKIRGFISHDTSLLVYKTMIRPYMDYGDFVVDSAHISKVDKLDRIQERIVRLIEYCPLRENREDINVLLKRYNLESLRNRRKRSLLRIDNSGWSVNYSALFDGAEMRWYQRKYHVLYTIRKQIINSIY